MSAEGFALPGRLVAEERMDTEAVPFDDYRGCLRDLETLNRLSLGYRPTLHALAGFAAGRDRLSVLDVGCGHGDGLRRIRRFADRAGIEADLVGVDINPQATRAAREATPPDMRIAFETADLFDIGPERRFDVIVSALFAHHLADADLLRFVRWMDRTAAVGWFVNDLHRHPLPHLFLKVTLGPARMHRFVRHDGPVSVRRAFRREDWTALLRAAGIPAWRADVRWWLPFRWGVCVRTGAVR